MNLQAKVALEKATHPERFCPAQGCLWRTVVSDPVTRQMKTAKGCVNGFCLRHSGQAPQPAIVTTAQSPEKDPNGILAEMDDGTFMHEVRHLIRLGLDQELERLRTAKLAPNLYTARKRFLQLLGEDV